jgi:hypothetical protein
MLYLNEWQLLYFEKVKSLRYFILTKNIKKTSEVTSTRHLHSKVPKEDDKTHTVGMGHLHLSDSEVDCKVKCRLFRMLSNSINSYSYLTIVGGGGAPCLWPLARLSMEPDFFVVVFYEDDMA